MCAVGSKKGARQRVRRAEERRPPLVRDDVGPPLPKRAFLVTEDGFARRLALNLIAINAIVELVLRTPALYRLADDAYGRANDFALSTAHRMAWWSLLGLLSSSCCALQLLLNALSFGCAGFNAVLGPIRPTSVAVTLTVQALSWRVAWSRPWQWAPTASASVVVLSLTFLPEVLSVSATLRGYWRRREARGGCGSEDGAADREPTSKTLRFRVDNIGCAACVSAVTRVLEGIHFVEDFSVSLSNGIVTVIATDENCDQEKTNGGIECKEIMQKLNDAGFPLIPLEVSSPNDSKKYS
mmetsp:Transcript_51197/g.153796  ORF Transcript_51197/g.153796 Transcript_51197/m.153796 type:complete len:297 (-) Transcript_51197:271-1161(-)